MNQNYMLSVQSFSTLISQYLPEPHAGLLSGICFGTKVSLDPALKDALIATGTLHIVALSGMNITILTKMVNIVFLGLLPRKIAGGLTMLVIFGFVWFVGPSPSVVRAAIMGFVTIIAGIFGRNSLGLISWVIAAGGMFLFKPTLITDLSFQLSTLASLGLIVFERQRTEDGEQKTESGEQIAEKIFPPSVFRLPFSVIKSELHTTLAAQAFTIPLIFFVFHRVSLIAPLTNLLIGWTIPIITVLGLLTCMIGVILFPVGQIFAWFTWVFLSYVLHMVTWTSIFPGASVGF